MDLVAAIPAGFGQIWSSFDVFCLPFRPGLGQLRPVLCRLCHIGGGADHKFRHGDQVWSVSTCNSGGGSTACAPSGVETDTLHFVVRAPAKKPRFEPETIRLIGTGPPTHPPFPFPLPFPFRAPLGAHAPRISVYARLAYPRTRQPSCGVTGASSAPLRHQLTQGSRGPRRARTHKEPGTDVVGRKQRGNKNASWQAFRAGPVPSSRQSARTVTLKADFVVKSDGSTQMLGKGRLRAGMARAGGSCHDTPKLFRGPNIGDFKQIVHSQTSRVSQAFEDDGFACAPDDASCLRSAEQIFLRARVCVWSGGHN